MRIFRVPTNWENRKFSGFSEYGEVGEMSGVFTEIGVG